jgi:hypothetical protein
LASCGGEDSAADEPPAAAPPPSAAGPAPTPTEGAVPWPTPDDPLERARAAGLEPGRREFLDYHVHAHLDVFLNGEAVEVPAAVGIEISDPGVQSGDDGLGGTTYGGIDRCDQPCISPLHTHDRTGILHTESALEDPNTLGQFFIEWDVRLDEKCVGGYCEPEAAIAVYVDGLEFGGDPATIALDNGREIAIVIGTPPAEIPASYDFSGGV